MRAAGLRTALLALCVTEVTSWGVLYYAFPVMLADLTADTGWSTAEAIGAFSTGALVSAVGAVPVGRLIDSRGPRAVMTSGSVLGVLSVLALAAAPTLGLFYLAWAVAGVAQAATLYPPAFAALTGWYPESGRIRALTALTLVAGLSSTVFAPLTAALLGGLSWRQAYLVLAGVLLVVTVPLHALCLTPPWPGSRHARAHARDEDRAHSGAVVRSRPFLVLVAVMTVTGFGSYAATINLVPLLTARGYGTEFGAWALGLVGVGQVLGRFGYAPLARRSPVAVRTAVIPAAAALCVAAIGLLPGPASALIVLTVLAGAARGAHTLLQASAVADRWGTRAFGRVNGVFSAPITAAIALAPAGGAYVAEWLGSYPTAFVLLAALTALASAAALATSVPPPTRESGLSSG
ncbi:MFS transporter [Pseudonocardia acaciae]|uniref:MFS transporter n=1 Tax=Pseudonocardia acaciae TaxID=551276 RepID=UPI00048F2670|nr:MFS transporter [Pseudonocardia acaciae]